MLQSLVFRLILIFYAVSIVERETGFVANQWYYLICIGYLLGYLWLKVHEHSILRLLWDFVFINIIIFNRNINEPIISMFVLLPLINAINFSGRNNHSWLLMCLISVTFFVHLRHLSSWFLTPIISLWIIYALSWVKYREWSIIKSITTHIDTYFVNKEQIEKPHKIYLNIIQDLNKFFFKSNKEGIIRICAYTLKGKTLWLINSSCFMWKRTLEMNPARLERLKERKYMKMGNPQKTKIHFFYLQQGELEYVFICETTDDKSLALFRFRHICSIVFSKMAVLLNSEYRISEIRNRKFDEIKDNVLYVNKAVRIMHFIRNRMTPLTNLIAYYQKADTLPLSIKVKMGKRMKREVKQADSDLKEILSTANYLLEKSNNPFAESIVKNVSITKIFIVVSEIAERLLEGTVNVEDNIINASNMYVATNLVESKIMFTDWINNMRKYKHDYYSISISLIDDELIVSFVNDYNPQETSDDVIKKLVSNINSNSKDAVIEGKNSGHGIFIIKSIASGLHVKVSASIEQSENKRNILCLTLKYKVYEYQDNSHI
mgnify:CR=1 FL=1